MAAQTNNKAALSEKILLTVEDVSSLTGYSDDTIRRLIKSNLISAWHVPPVTGRNSSKQLRITWQALYDFIDKINHESEVSNNGE